MSNTLAIKPTAQFDLSPQTFEQALTFSQYLADSDMVPKDFKGKPGNCLVAMQWGAEIGLKPLQAMQNIAVINGRPALWGDAVIALVRSSPACEYVIEEDDGRTATCKVKRRGEPEQFRTFSADDAKAAGLIGKQGPWTQYPKRMRQMRARAFALRDVFPDVLKGLPVAEEVMDTPTDMGPAIEVKPSATPAQPAASQDLIDQAAQAANAGMASYQAFWKQAGEAGRKALASGGHHEACKRIASESDAARTVEAPAPAAQEPASKTFDEIMAMLCSATTEDALYVAVDWAAALGDADQVSILEAKFDERLAQIRNAA